MIYKDDFLDKKLQERKSLNAFRKLSLPEEMTDFCSNDYLGIAKGKLLYAEKDAFKTGSGGSRLLAGNYPLIEQTESKIAAFHGSPAALIFNSGYDANLGLLSCVAQRGDTILYDSLAHASLRDGIRLSFAQSFSFLHNDLTDLEKKLRLGTGNIFVVTESVFSMDGDLCPLQELVQLAKKYRAHLIIDEAHATGVIGEHGEGLVQHLQLHQEVFCRIHTFGKACGCHGAAVVGSVRLRDYLINFCRSFIYTTSLPEQAVAVISRSYDVFPAMIPQRNKLVELINLFQSGTTGFEKNSSPTPIQVVTVPGNDTSKKLAETLQQHRMDVRAILYPTVPKGKERLRIVLHAFNTHSELLCLTELLQKAYSTSIRRK